MTQRMLCFGDSNTFGYCADPQGSTCGDFRFAKSERWCGLLQASLGPSFEVIEEGLCGRTTAFDDPTWPEANGAKDLPLALKKHAPLNLLVLMLGTNDCKEHFGASAADIAHGMERLVRIAQNSDCWANEPHILVVAPPPIGRASRIEELGEGFAEKSEALVAHYKAMAERLNCEFLDAAGCEFNTNDYMHLTRKGHAQLAEKVRPAISSAL